jgi:peroxiredoxin
MNKKILCLALCPAFLFLASCKDQGKGYFQVKGTYKNVNVSKVVLLSLSSGKDQSPVSIDSQKISGGSGSFSLKGRGKAEEIFELVFGDNIPVPFINDAPEIQVDLDMGKKDDYYTVRGSLASSQLKDLITNFGLKNYAVEKNFAELDSLKRMNASDSVMIAVTTAKNNSISELNEYLKKCIETSSTASLRILALGWAARSFSNTDFEKELADAIKKYPGNAMLLKMKIDYSSQKSQAAETSGNWIGKAAPDLGLQDVSGNPVPISSFKGKWLLVDFWASWCGPCRMENPNVAKAYNLFKDKNFTILGVSLDKDKDAWVQAIKDDKLAWTQVSDLKFWNSKAAEVFGFQGIPFNVLIDPQGKIIARELRGPDLENKLKEVLQ